MSPYRIKFSCTCTYKIQKYAIKVEDKFLILKLKFISYKRIYLPKDIKIAMASVVKILKRT